MVYGNVRLIYPDQESALLDFVAGGGGLVGVHVASWTFTNSPAYGTMIGGRFKGHHAITEYSQTFADAEPAILSGLTPYTSEDEPYLNQAFNPDIKVLSWRDPVGATEIATSFKEPYTWIRYQGLGRVFYHAGGHDYRTWSQAGFRELLARGVHWVCRGALGGPRVSDTGTVVFEGEFDAAPAILKESSADGLVPLARSGDSSPSSIGGSWDLPASALSVESGAGEISFIAGLDPGDTGPVQTLISEREGVLSALLADGDTVPGLGSERIGDFSLVRAGS